MGIYTNEVISWYADLDVGWVAAVYDKLGIPAELGRVVDDLAHDVLTAEPDGTIWYLDETRVAVCTFEREVLAGAEAEKWLEENGKI